MQRKKLNALKDLLSYSKNFAVNTAVIEHAVSFLLFEINCS